MIARCPVCVGKKTIMGLGCIIKKCPECSGVGHIKVKEVEKNLLQAIDEEIKQTFTQGFAKELKGNIEKSADVVKIDRRKKEFRNQ